MIRRLAILLPALALGCNNLGGLAPMLGNTKISYTLKNGEKVEGTLLQSEEGQSLVQLRYGAVTVTTGDIASSQILGEDAAVPAGPGRFATLARALRVMAEQPWGSSLLQVPATLVSAGTLRNVPYASLRAGNFEVNVYGDPDAPAGLEVGVYGSVHSAISRRVCLAALKRALADPADQAFLDGLPLDGGKKARAGLTFEVTPPTAPDAFGGWWISVYDEKALDQQRASDAELAVITIPRSRIKTAPTPSVTAWKPHELRLSRPEEMQPGDPGRVYLRGIHRKNGAYVAAKPL